MGAIRLIDQIGEVVQLVEPDAYATDVAASANDAGVPVQGANGVLFVLAAGDLDSSTIDVAIQYSTSGNATDASASTTIWESTDVFFAQVDSDGENEVYLLDLDLRGKTSITEEAGKLYADVQGVGAAEDYALFAIPYGMRSAPSTNENTIKRV